MKNTIVISGGASGIGLAAVEKFLTKDFNVFVLDNNQVLLEELESSQIAYIDSLKTKHCDITNSQDVSNAMDECIRAFGSINAVLPAAGIVSDSLFIKVDRETNKVKSCMSEEQFRKVVDVNLTGTFNTIQQAAIRMINNNSEGVIYLVSSINHTGQLGQLNYCSTKHALAQWPKILVGEFHKQNINNIRVVSISPGYVETPILDKIRPEIKQAIIDDIAAKRLITREEIVETLWFIWKNKAINATNIEVSGGQIQRGVCK